jgi:hypothetical protein
MNSEFLYRVPEVAIAGGLLLLMGCAGVGGHMLGRTRRTTEDAMTRVQFVSLQTAILGLLSLLLGFTFAMAMSRYEYRKQMVVLESNAIGTAALRAGFLPVADEARAQALFKRYVQVRLESVMGTSQASVERRRLDEEVFRLQTSLWSLASSAAEADPRSVPLGLFLSSMNELIDIKTRRDIAVANHVPEIVVLFLLGLAIVAIGVVAYGDALAGTRRPGLTAVFAIISALVVLLIVDLDRPQQGLARVSQSSMTLLQQRLEVD